MKISFPYLHTQLKSKAALLSSQPSLAGEIWITTLHDMDSTTEMEKNAIMKNYKLFRNVLS